MKKLFFVFIASLILLAYPIFSASASLRGSIAAHLDIHRGHYKVLGYGLPTRSLPEYARCLHDRYGIEHQAVAGCTVSKNLIDYVNAYHSVTAASTQQKFGHNVFKECSREADRFDH